MKKKSLKVSVTALADFSCRSGDLELSGNIGPTAREGMKAHQRIQSQRSVESEVRLSIKSIVRNVNVSLSGRVDLLDANNNRLSEIKTTLVPTDKLTESKLSLQWAQITLYGYCYCLTQLEQNKPLSPDGVELELIHADIRAEAETSSVRTLTFEAMEAFALNALTRYVQWYEMLWEWQEKTRSSAAKLAFPHEHYREGQRDMAAAIFRSTRDGESLLCEAPTGTGKTLSSVFPVVKAIGEGYVKHAVYLTAKTSGRQSAMQAVRQLEQAGLLMTSVMIRSKSPTCFCSNGRCERDDKNTCPMTIGFFDRLPDARDEAIAIGVLDGERLDEIAWQHQICPFEFALQLLPWVSFCIADFNYVFDPLVRIGRFSESRRDTALLIDEAHNLVDRARGMHSGHLHRGELIAAHKLISSSHPVLAGRIKSLTNKMMRLGQSLPETSSPAGHGQDVHSAVTSEVPEKLVKLAGDLVSAYTDALDQSPAMPETLFDIFKMACRFVAISDLYGDQHKTITSVSENQRQIDVRINLKCLDAARYLEPQYKIFRNTVVFSATLRPAPFYRDALGLPSESQQLVLNSPFSPDQVKHCVVGYINTRYQYRSSSINDLIKLLHVLLKSKPGNYMVFFPSYAYLEQAHTAFSKKHPTISTWQQPRNADADERARLLAQLDEAGVRLGFAILGGVFGEGIDYVGDALIGVVLVGVGLPGLGVEQDLIADCYRQQGLDGFDYAYRYPGFTKVLQTAGRVIRTETDKGVVMLVDDRFNQAFYRALFPDHWCVESVNTIEDVERDLNGFWESQNQLAF